MNENTLGKRKQREGIVWKDFKQRMTKLEKNILELVVRKQNQEALINKLEEILKILISCSINFSEKIAYLLN